MPTSIVIGSIFLACDKLLEVKELAVDTSAKFINDCGFHIYKHCSGYMPARACLPKEDAKEVISSQWSCHLASSHQAGYHVPRRKAPNKDCPSSTSLTNMNGDALSRGGYKLEGDRSRHEFSYLLRKVKSK